MLYVAMRYPYIIYAQYCLYCDFKFWVLYIISTVLLFYLHPIMPPKRLASSPASAKEPKRQKKAMTLHENVELLDMVKLCCGRALLRSE